MQQEAIGDGGACCSSCAAGGLGELGDPLIWTPGAIGSLRDQVNTEIMAIAADATRAWFAGLLTAATWKPWKAFLNEWIAYRDDIGFTGLLTGATVDRIREYQRRAVEWRSKLGSAGIQFTAPAPSLAKPSPAPAWLKWAVFGLVGVGGAYAIGKVAGALDRS